MKFDELDAKMRVFETAHDYCVLPDVFMVARIDGRSFTRLTKEVQKFEVPFDVRMRDLMVETTKHLMTCGFDCFFGYTQSDEISLLFHPDITTFDRKTRKFNSILAGEASAKFSQLLNDRACFDCRISELPNANLVVDYFRWRNEDANRNALNGWCYWTLRKKGLSVKETTEMLEGKSVAYKNELLFQHGINFNEVPLWQSRGTGLYWESYEKPAVNKLTGEEVTAMRRRIKVDFELPVKDIYSEFIKKILTDLSE